MLLNQHNYPKIKFAPVKLLNSAFGRFLKGSIIIALCIKYGFFKIIKKYVVRKKNIIYVISSIVLLSFLFIKNGAIYCKFKDPVTSFCVVVAHLSVGFYEELLFRVFFTGYILKYFKTKDNDNSIIKALIISSCVFGVFHLQNGFSIETYAQIIYAGFLGVSFFVLYLKSGNIVLPMILHALINISGSLFVNPEINNAGFINRIGNGIDSIIVTLFLAIIAFVILKQDIEVRRKTSLKVPPKRLYLKKKRLGCST